MQGWKGAAEEVRLDEVAFKSNHRAYHLFDKDRNQLPSLQKLHPWSQGEETRLENLVKRLLLIIDPHH